MRVKVQARGERRAEKACVKSVILSVKVQAHLPAKRRAGARTHNVTGGVLKKRGHHKHLQKEVCPPRMFSCKNKRRAAS